MGVNHDTVHTRGGGNQQPISTVMEIFQQGNRFAVDTALEICPNQLHFVMLGSAVQFFGQSLGTSGGEGDAVIKDQELKRGVDRWFNQMPGRR